MRDCDKESISFRHEKSSARAICGIDFGDRLIVVRISLLYDVDLARTAYGIYPTAFVVAKDFIRITGDVDLGNDVARVRVQHDEFRRQSAPNEQSVICLIERHRKICKSQIC